MSGEGSFDSLGESARGWSPNLLTHVATTIGHHRLEDVASASLAYLFSTDDAARRALVAELAQRAQLNLGSDLPSDLTFIAQERGAEGQPDVVGRDGENHSRVAVEAKIGAAFQPRQIAGYANQLDGKVPGLVVVLAPERRLLRLLSEAGAQLGEAGHLLSVLADSPMTLQTADRLLTLVGLSWTKVLDVMAGVSASPDVAELRGLYEYIDAEVFLPLSLDDLSAANGRLLWSLASVAQSVAGGFTADERGDAKHGWSAIGQWLRLNGRRAWFGVWLEAWARRADTPYWLTYYKDDLPIAVAQTVVLSLDGLPNICAHHDGKFLCIGLFPCVEAERATVEQSLVALIRLASNIVPQ